MRVLVTRPREDGEATAARLRAMGHAALLAPLLQTAFLDGPPPDLSGVQAILATSANGVRAFARRSPRRDLPLFAVGPQTCDEARTAGFADVRNADGDVNALAAATGGWAKPQNGALLHISGEALAGRLGETLAEQGFEIRKQTLYRVVAASALPDAVKQALAENTIDAALFFSPRSAAVFCDLAKDFSMGCVMAACISEAAARALAPLAFAQIRTAAAPNQDALLALL